MMKLNRITILGFFAGLFLGMGDYWLLRAADITMLIDGEDVTLVVVSIFALNFGALAALIARLWQRGNELAAMQSSLVEAETLAAVGRMAAGVAHEVRNPLSVIKSSAQMLHGTLEGEDAQVAEFIGAEVDRLDDFVGRVLDFSRPLSAQPAAITWADLKRRLAPIVGEGVALEGDAHTYVLDPDLTVQLLTNLVDNARKSDAAAVRVLATPGAIEVSDDGHGVQPELRASVFEPFFTTRAKGTGLGLAMARKLARVQGWDLEIAAEGGLGPDQRGATFRFRTMEDH